MVWLTKGIWNALKSSSKPLPEMCKIVVTSHYWLSMERQNCLMILFFVILGGCVIVFGAYVVVFGD